jgi:hypothetical protein
MLRFEVSLFVVPREQSRWVVLVTMINAELLLCLLNQSGKKELVSLLGIGGRQKEKGGPKRTRKTRALQHRVQKKVNQTTK